MTRRNKEDGSSVMKEDSDAKELSHEDSQIVQFVRPPKIKRQKNKAVTSFDKIGEEKISSEKKKLRFNIEGQVLPAKEDKQTGGKESAEKKKVRKPRWSEERKLEERKRKSEEPQTVIHESHHPPKKAKKKASKKKIKMATETSNSSALSTSAIQYLQHWHYDQTSWKFSKIKQIWLLKNIFDLKKIPSSVFPVLVKYISTCRGGARMKTYQAAEKVIKKLEEEASSVEPEYDEEKEIEKCLEGEQSEEDKKEIHHRARSIMQELSDCT